MIFVLQYSTTSYLPSLFQVTNFFEFQPVQNAAVYFLRLILHDWPDEKCLAILKILRRAAGPLSKLIVFEQIMAYSCKYSGPFADVSNPIKAPAPLLANLGMGAGGFITMIDMQVKVHLTDLCCACLHQIFNCRCSLCSMEKREL